VDVRPVHDKVVDHEIVDSDVPASGRIPATILDEIDLSCGLAAERGLHLTPGKSRVSVAGSIPSSDRVGYEIQILPTIKAASAAHGCPEIAASDGVVAALYGDSWRSAGTVLQPTLKSAESAVMAEIFREVAG
jgi:hypothetical protein